MNDLRDMELLREYVDHGTERAFEIVVSRHLGLVYHSALRHAGQRELAQDVSQTVFTLLARKAARLSPQTVLTGWLVTTTRFVASRAIRAEMRRRRRDEAAFQMSAEPSEAVGETEAMLPFLDQSLAELRAVDRDALSLRYLEGRSFAEVAVALGATEEAARKRVQRSLERLRGLLGRRGVSVGGAALASGLGALSSQAAPTGLAAVISGTAIQQAGGVIAISLLTQTSLHLMKFAHWKSAVVVIAAIALASTTSVLVIRSGPSPTPTMSQAPNHELEQRVQRLELENRRLAGALAAEKARAPAEIPPSPAAPKAQSADPRAGLLALMDNPAMRKIQEAAEKKAIETMYTDLADELHLSPAEREEFFRLLNERGMISTNLGLKLLRASPDERKALRDESKQASTAADGNIRDFLNNDADYATYQAYTSQLGDRSDLRSMQPAFERIQQPLSPTQQKSLLDLMQQTRTAVSPPPPAVPEDEKPLVPSAGDEARQLQDLEETQKRILAGAGAILTPGQLEILNQNQVESLQMRKANLEMQRSLLGAQSGKNSSP